MTHRNSLTHLVLTLLALSVAGSLVACGPDAPPPPPAPPPTGPVTGTIATDALLDTFLTSPQESIRKQARAELLNRREAVIPAAREVFANRGIDEFPVELVQLLVDLGEQKQIQHELVRVEGREPTQGPVPLLTGMLESLDTNPDEERRLSILEEPLAPTEGLEGERKKLVQEGNDRLIIAQQNMGRTFVALVTAHLELGAEKAIPVRQRILYFSSVLAEHAQRRDSTQVSAIEAATALLELPQSETLTTIASKLNHPDDRVARRFFGISLWLHHRPLVKAILDQLEQHGARNMQVYTLLGHLTLRPVRLADVGIERPDAKAYQANREQLLAEWHPKLLAEWKTWWAANGKKTPDDWWLRGLQDAGVEISDLRSRESVPALIGALKHEVFEIRIAALNLLQRLTFRGLARTRYLELTDYDPSEALRKAYPHAKEKLTEAQALQAMHDDWQSWWEQRKAHPAHQLAREEAAGTLALLERLGKKTTSLIPREIEVGFCGVFYLRHLTTDPTTGLPGVPPLKWSNDMHARRQRTRLIAFFPRLVERKLGAPAVQQALERGWWFR